MLKVYRGWIVTPLNRDTLIAEKNGRTFTGQWHEIVVDIDSYEYDEAREEKKDESASAV